MSYSMENKITCWGTLDTAARTLEDIPTPLMNLYNRGEYRMRPDDVKRMEAYLKRIATSTKQIKAVAALFKQLNK